MDSLTTSMTLCLQINGSVAHVATTLTGKFVGTPLEWLEPDWLNFSEPTSSCIAINFGLTKSLTLGHAIRCYCAFCQNTEALSDIKMQEVSTRQAMPMIRLFENLEGTWNFTRYLHGNDPSEPSGHCSGTATFTKREPSEMLDSDGNLLLASSELLYQEHGELEIATNNISRASSRSFPFSRKYIWRFQEAPGVPKISIWFTKPGTELIDYLFHNISVAEDSVLPGDPSPGNRALTLVGNGSHLCVEDLYSSSYGFSFSHVHGLSDSEISFDLTCWSTVHEVRGPKKDQLIETSFSRP